MHSGMQDRILAIEEALGFVGSIRHTLGANGEHWTFFAIARDRSGHPCEVDSAFARSWCLTGARWHVLSGIARTDLRRIELENAWREVKRPFLGTPRGTDVWVNDNDGWQGVCARLDAVEAELHTRLAKLKET